MIFQLIMSGAYVPRTDKMVLGGTIKENGVPAKKRIMIFHKKTYEIIASAWSDATTGIWKISNTNEYPDRMLYVVAFDDTGTYNAEIADFVSQVVPS